MLNCPTLWLSSWRIVLLSELVSVGCGHDPGFLGWTLFGPFRLLSFDSDPFLVEGSTGRLVMGQIQLGPLLNSARLFGTESDCVP